MRGRLVHRGEVFWVSSDASQGGEIRKRRPVVTVSNNSASRHLNRVQVVALTSNTDRLVPSEAIVTVSGRTSKAMADQIATATKERLGDLLGSLSDADMSNVEDAVRRQLGLL